MNKQLYAFSLPSFSELRKIYDGWTWQEIRWGMRRKIISMPEALSLAVEQLNEDTPLLEPLLDLVTEKPDSLEIDRKVDAVCEAEEPEEDVEYAWRLVILIWLFRTEKNDEMLEQKVQLLWADFDHPDNMRKLIRWMPPAPGEPPSPLPWNIRTQIKDYLAKHPLPRRTSISSFWISI